MMRISRSLLCLVAMVALGMGCDHRDHRDSVEKDFPTTKPMDSELVGTYDVTDYPSSVYTPTGRSTLTLNGDNSFTMVEMPGWEYPGPNGVLRTLSRGQLISGTGTWGVAQRQDRDVTFYGLNLDFEKLGARQVNIVVMNIDLREKGAHYQILLPTDPDGYGFIVLEMK